MAQYNLIEAQQPEIILGCAVKDPGFGGIKLKYSVSEEYSITKSNSKEIIFLKPYKENWAKNKKACKKEEWGNTRSVFANVWMKIPKDYTNFNENFPEIFHSFEKITDPRLIKNLNNQSNKFIIEEVDTKSMSNFKKRTLLILGLIYNNIKNRIFINNQKTEK